MRWERYAFEYELRDAGYVRVRRRGLRIGTIQLDAIGRPMCVNAEGMLTTNGNALIVIASEVLNSICRACALRGYE